MGFVDFEWDKRKATSNKKKHGVSFEEARSAFFDENALIFKDPDHSDQEDRFILLETSSMLRTIVVCHCYKENDNVIRIISARKADKKEQMDYSGK